MRTKYYHSKYQKNGCADYSKEGFYAHLWSYVCVIGMLWMICFFTGSYKYQLWPIYPMLGWGMGLLGHYSTVLKHGGFDSNEEVVLKDKDFI